MISETHTPLLSQIGIELEDGQLVWLNNTFTMPLGWAGLEGANLGRRAPDSAFVVRSGDRRGNSYTLTASGLLSATTSAALVDELNLLADQAARCRRIWRGRRCHADVAYGVMPPPTMGTGWLSADVSIVFFVARLGWRTPEGQEVHF